MNDLKNLLTVPFSSDNYKKFSINFLKNVDTVPLIKKEPPLSFKKYIESYTVYGTYKDDKSRDIIVLSVKVSNNSSARQLQRHFVSYLLENEFNNFNAALVAYYDDIRLNWKLSFITVEYELSDKGIELKYKPAKRFSFLVGKDEPTKTYAQQLSPIYESNNKPTLEEITDAFSVSRVSREFYEDYRNKYYELFDYLVNNPVFNNEGKNLGYDDINKWATTFCKKTLGQIVFLHFIQKRGWLGVTKEWGDGDKQYLINSIREFNGKNYFNEFLEPLFYNALNIKRENDLYLGKKVPFLNGGLFHPIEDYDWENTDFNIPNFYWSNKNEDGFLDLLSQYNFTVDETDPEEQEVAIDPEMLGKIFESLLDTNDRSQLGAFYTPREIVHYMCEESLATRISKALNLDYESILNYIKYGDALKESEFINEFADDIDNYVMNMTICDPAVGSGAFLVGMLNEIVKLHTNLMQVKNLSINKYETKLQIIQHCLYGVDIEYDAVEIAKLRLWLSLIVDEELDNKHCPNPLPNLNFHLRIGNSLVDTFDGIKLWNVRWRGTKKDSKTDDQINLFNVDAVNSILSRLKELKVKYFNASDDRIKQELLQQIEREQIELIRSELVAKGKYKVFDSIEEMIKKKTKPFFIWELEFEEVFEKGGFDIVIANPPYVQLQKDGGKLADQLKDQGYKTFARMGDIYCIFYEKGIDLLKEKGVLCYITSNKWMRAGYGDKLRGFLAEESNPIKLIDFGGNKIFESATVDVNILLASKEKNNRNTLAVIIDIDCTNNLSDFINQNAYLASYITQDNWTILSSQENEIKNKLDKYGKKLKDWNIRINYGIKTGLNEAFIIDSNKKDELIKEDPRSAAIIRPILRGRDIKRFDINYADLYVIATFPSKRININDYPAIKKYLLSFDKRVLSQSGEKNIDGIEGKNARKKTGNKWFETQDQINYSDDFYKQKIVYPETTQGAYFYLDNEGYFIDKTCFMLIGDEMKYLIGILSSSLFQFAYKRVYSSCSLSSSGYQYNKAAFLNLPVLEPTHINKRMIEDIVEFCIRDKNESSYNKLNNAVFDLYDISNELREYINNYQ